MFEDDMKRKIRQSNFLRNQKPNPTGFPETDDIFGLDRIKVNRKRFYCPNPAHLHWEEYYEVSIDGQDYHLFNWGPHDEKIAEVYPGKEYGRSVIRLKQEVCDALTEMDKKSSVARDCVNLGALKMFHKDLYAEYLKFQQETNGGSKDE